MDETTPTPAASNKTWLYVGLAVVALIILGFLFMGQGNPAAYFAPAGTDVDRNMDGSATYTTNEGSVTVGSNKMPENWPSDAPTAYTGATILYSGSTNPQTGAAGSAVSYSTNATAQAVVDYYTNGLKGAGWTIASSAEMAGIRVISATKDTRTMGVYIQDAGNGTVNVTAGIEL